MRIRCSEASYVLAPHRTLHTFAGLWYSAPKVDQFHGKHRGDITVGCSRSTTCRQRCQEKWAGKKKSSC